MNPKILTVLLLCSSASAQLQFLNSILSQTAPNLLLAPERAFDGLETTLGSTSNLLQNILEQLSARPNPRPANILDILRPPALSNSILGLLNPVSNLLGATVADLSNLVLGVPASVLSTVSSIPGLLPALLSGNLNQVVATVNAPLNGLALNLGNFLGSTGGNLNNFILGVNPSLTSLSGLLNAILQTPPLTPVGNIVGSLAQNLGPTVGNVPNLLKGLFESVGDRGVTSLASGLAALFNPPAGPVAAPVASNPTQNQIRQFFAANGIASNFLTN